MMIFKKFVPRRTFLRSAGAALALPLLDAMVPAFAAATSGPPRVAFAYVPNGIIMPKWTPATDGAGFEFTPILEPLRPFQDQLLVLTGLAHNEARAKFPDEAGGFHPRASTVFLTGAHPKRTEGADLRAGTSVDQVAARELGKETQLSSLELAIDATDLLGGCDTGYSCAYSNTLSWRTATSPLPMENQPRAVFERLFGDTESTEPRERLARIQEKNSILDFLRGRMSSLSEGLGPKDKAKVNEYFESVRDVERRIQKAEEQSSRQLPVMDRPEGVPTKYSDHVKLMADLQVLAFQTDTTRVATFMMGREQGTRVYDELGISESHHPLTHHQGDANKIEQVIRIDILHTQMLAYLAEKLRSIKEGNGNLLDRTMLVYGACISDGNLHLNQDLPVVMLGSAGGVKMGRHIRYPKDTPMSNLYLTILDSLGIHLDSFGDSNGRLAF